MSLWGPCAHLNTHKHTHTHGLLFTHTSLHKHRERVCSVMLALPKLPQHKLLDLPSPNAIMPLCTTHSAGRPSWNNNPRARPHTRRYPIEAPRGIRKSSIKWGTLCPLPLPPHTHTHLLLFASNQRSHTEQSYALRWMISYNHYPGYSLYRTAARRESNFHHSCSSKICIMLWPKKIKNHVRSLLNKNLFLCERESCKSSTSLAAVFVTTPTLFFICKFMSMMLNDLKTTVLHPSHIKQQPISCVQRHRINTRPILTC